MQPTSRKLHIAWWTHYPDNVTWDDVMRKAYERQAIESAGSPIAKQAERPMWRRFVGSMDCLSDMPVSGDSNSR